MHQYRSVKCLNRSLCGFSSHQWMPLPSVFHFRKPLSFPWRKREWEWAASCSHWGESRLLTSATRRKRRQREKMNEWTEKGGQNKISPLVHLQYCWRPTVKPWNGWTIKNANGPLKMIRGWWKKQRLLVIQWDESPQFIIVAYPSLYFSL